MNDEKNYFSNQDEDLDESKEAQSVVLDSVKLYLKDIGDWPLLTAQEEIELALKSFVGKITQLPPVYSALKINGKNAYEIARKGGEVELKTRPIEILDFKLLGKVSNEKKEELKDRFLNFHAAEELEMLEIESVFENNLFEFEITCSSGTYIRSLARDVAQKISTCGTMLCITRTRCGNFDIKNSFSLEEIKAGKFCLHSTFDVVNLPVLTLSKEEAKNLLDGKKLLKLPILESEFKVVCDGEFYGIGNNKNGGNVKISTFLKEEN